MPPARLFRRPHFGHGRARFAAVVWVFTGASTPVWAHGDLHAQLEQTSAALAQELAKPVDGHERANLYFARGELYRQHGDWTKAAADYDQALRYEPDFDAVALARAKLLLDSGDPAAALPVLARFLGKHVDHPEALLIEAAALVKLDRGLDAVRGLDRAIARHPQPEPDHYLARVDILQALGPQHLARAVRGLDQGMKRLGPIVSLAERAIAIELELGRFDHALARIDRQLRVSPRPDLWLARRAEVLDRAGRAPAAARARREALAAIDALPPAQKLRPATRDLERQLLATQPSR